MLCTADGPAQDVHGPHKHEHHNCVRRRHPNRDELVADYFVALPQVEILLVGLEANGYVRVHDAHGTGVLIGIERGRRDEDEGDGHQAGAKGGSQGVKSSEWGVRGSGSRVRLVRWLTAARGSAVRAGWLAEWLRGGWGCAWGDEARARVMVTRQMPKAMGQTQHRGGLAGGFVDWVVRGWLGAGGLGVWSGRVDQGREGMDGDWG